MSRFEEQPENRPRSNEVDIPLDIPESRGYDATVPEELRKERGDATLAEELVREAKKQQEYIQLTQLYAELQALVLQHVLPDDYRQSLPQEIGALIDELVPEFRKLSLYRSTTAEQVKQELEGRVRRQELDGKRRELQELIRASRERIGEIKAAQETPVLPRTYDGLSEAEAARVAQILKKMQGDNVFKAMPVVGESAPRDATSSKSFFSGVKRLFGKK